MTTHYSRMGKSFRAHLLRDVFALLVLTFIVSVLAMQFLPLHPWFGSHLHPFDELILGSMAAGIALGALSLRALLQLERQSSRLSALYRTAQLASSTLDPSEVVSQAVEAIRDIMGYSHVLVDMLQGDRLVAVAWAGYGDRPPDLRLDQGITGRVARTGQAAFVPDVSLDPDFLPAVQDPDPNFSPLVQGTASEIACPITVEGKVLGVLNVETIGGRRLGRDDLDLVGSLALHLGMALHNATRYEHTREQAIRDGLTSLYDHAYFAERLREEVLRARRYGRSLSLIMLDLDDFKRVNDAYGHLEGDRVLRAFAEFVKNAIRRTDLPARYGGEEFAIILPETRGPEAGVAAERLRRRLEKEILHYMDGVGISLTASCGVAGFPEDAVEAEGLIRRADEALYAAKRNGKNQVHVAHSEPREQILEAG